MKKKKAHKLVSSQYEDGYVPVYSHSDKVRQIHNSKQTLDAKYDDEGMNPLGNARSTSLSHSWSRQTNAFPRQVVLKAPRNAQDVKIALEEEFLQWGIKDDKRADHEKFAKLAMAEALGCYRGGTFRWCPPDLSASVPPNSSDAIPFLLDFFLRRMTDNGRRMTFRQTKDLVEEELGVHIPYSPYALNHSGGLSLNTAYANVKGINAWHLNPLIRFQHHNEDAEAVIRASWREMLVECRPSPIVEAAAIHKAIHGGHPCLTCGEKDSFQLNSKMDISFSDVICKSCGSLYVFWPTSNVQSIFNRLRRGHFHRGRLYGHFHEELRHLKKPSMMYAILLPMEGMPLSMPAYAAKILGALPSLSGKSFNLKKVNIYCNVLVESASKLWFHISLPSDLNLQRTLMDALSNYFDELKRRNESEALQKRSDTGENLLNVKTDTSKPFNFSSRSEIRQLRRLRNEIEALQKRLDRGETLTGVEMETLGKETDALLQLEQFENMLRLCG